MGFLLQFFSWLSTLQLPEGALEPLICDVSQLQNLNEQIHDQLESLRRGKFFRYFKVKLDDDCPFWAQNYFCELASCAVCECDSNEIPEQWEDYNENLDLSLQSTFKGWTEKTEPWIKQETPDAYVNLLLNGEAYTNYQGQHIWNAIYNENCFSSSEDLCVEERLFYQIISGLHSNINTHISRNFLHPMYNNLISLEQINGYLIRNITMFYDRVGNHQERIDNFYTAFALLVQSANKASSYIKNFQYTTGNRTEDDITRRQITSVMNFMSSQCDSILQESQFFQEAKGEALKDQIRRNFFNISRIIDCVGCEKCRLHGKLQIYGLGTAFKFLFTENPEIQRNELIAFVNTLAKFSRAEMIMRENIEEEILGKLIIKIWSLILFCIYYKIAKQIWTRNMQP